MDAIDTLLNVMQGKINGALAPAKRITTDTPKYRRRKTRENRRHFTPQRMQIPTDQVDWATLSIPEIMFRLHPELPTTFDAHYAYKLVAEKEAFPKSHKKRVMANLRNALKSEDRVLSKLYKWHPETQIYSKKFVTLEELKSWMVENKANQGKHPT